MSEPEASARPDAEYADWPTWHPPLAVLELAELAATTALPALPAPQPCSCSAGADGDASDSDVICTHAEHEEVRRGGWVLEDSEGTGVVAVAEGGVVRQLRAFAQGPLRGHRRTPAQVREALSGGSGEVVAVAVAGALSVGQVEQLGKEAAAGARLLWLPLIGADRPGPQDGALAPEALWRAVRAMAGEVGGIAVPLALPAGYDDLVPEIARAYGADRVAELSPAAEEPHPVFARELARAVRPVAQRGLVVFFTGLSGSGKSTVAKALADRLLEDGRRSLTLLDGDEVRRMLSAGLGFSAADRDANIARIGYVAAEVARHGGTAICAPIAPFAAVRAQVRELVHRAGGDLVLVHVATPLAECERRDRKGLYAKARAGEIPEFTGISSPYEAPTDADLVLDTTEISVEDGVTRVWGLLQERGYLVDEAQ